MSKDFSCGSASEDSDAKDFEFELFITNNSAIANIF